MWGLGGLNTEMIMLVWSQSLSCGVQVDPHLFLSLYLYSLLKIRTIKSMQMSY